MWRARRTPQSEIERPLAGKGISLVAKKEKYGCLKWIVGFPSGARAN